MSSRPTLTRRGALKATAGAAALASGLATPFIAKAATDLTFTLPWLAEGSNLIAYVAKSQGFWAKHGLNVTVSRGFGSTPAAEAIGAGKFDFGMSVATSGIEITAKGLPLVQLATTGYDATMCIAVLEDSPIRTPKDLEGKTIASVVTSGDYPFRPIFLKRAGVDESKIKPVLVDPKVRERLLLDKKVDALSGFAISMAPILYAAGQKPRFMLYSKYDLPLYHNVLMTQPARLAKDPGQCEAMVNGLVEAMKFTLLDPQAAQDIFLKAVPEMAMVAQAKERLWVGLGIWMYQAMYAPARTHGLGYGDPKDYATMIDLVMQNIATDPKDKKPELDAILTNRFTGKLKLSDAEWAKAESAVTEFKAVLS
ncbi:ABC transporter substrate-binding protein [Reyranella sp.]|uniref:ABC transporter substrate-binding protein n=1 Tax=Reyranella sp. TaxID=1929291 RepID=UPI003BAC44AF